MKLENIYKSSAFKKIRKLLIGAEKRAVIWGDRLVTIAGLNRSCSITKIAKENLKKITVRSQNLYKKVWSFLGESPLSHIFHSHRHSDKTSASNGGQCESAGGKLIQDALQRIADSSCFTMEGSVMSDTAYKSVGEVQGTQELRKIISRNALKNPDILSYSNRLEFKKLNPKFYRIIRNKLAGHIFNIKSIFPINGISHLFEGFSEDIVIPCLWSYLNRFFQNEISCEFSNQDKKWILDQFQATLSHHRISDANFSDAVQKVNVPDPENPVLVLGGYDWHAASYAFSNKVMLYWNGHNNFIRINSLQGKISQDKFKELVQRHNLDRLDFDLLIDEFKLSFSRLPLTFSKKKQKSGNCTYKASNGLIQILFGLRHSLNNSRNSPGESEVNEGLTQTKASFKKFVKYLKSEVTEELIKDYNEIKDRLDSIEELTTIKRILQDIIKHDNIKCHTLTPETRSGALAIIG